MTRPGSRHGRRRNLSVHCGTFGAEPFAYDPGPVIGHRPPGAPEIDARLHAERLAGPGQRRMYRAPLAGLPSGTMVDVGGAPWLVHDGRLLAWTPGGYRHRPVEAPGDQVTVITPRATVAVLAAGYRPVLHPSALAV